ncbi:MAG TPA: hypothetical protein VLK28_12555 [Methylomirabilota bacterium]|nr:hypothetical protein [Methylomirabilota bacterium]
MGVLEQSTLWDLQRFAGLYVALPLVVALMWAVAEPDSTWIDLRGSDRGPALLVLGLVATSFTGACILQYTRTALEMNFSFRFFAPFLPVLLLGLAIVTSASYCSVAGTRETKPLRARLLSAGSVVLLVLQLMVYVRSFRDELDYVSRYKRLLESQQVAAGHFVAARLPATEWLMVLYDAGATPYYSRRLTVDFGGLNGPEVVQLQRAGVMRDLIDYFFSFRPGAAVFTSNAPEHVTHWNRLSKAIVEDERFREYILVRKFSTDGTPKHLFVYFRSDLARD